MASPTQRNPQLDAWRGVAILGVLFGHFVSIRYINFGRVGVELFYALSGSLIGQLLFVKGDDLRAFAIKRFARVVPSMWLFCVGAIAIEAIRTGQMAEGVPFALVGLANYFQLPERLAHLWSVSVELQGYLALGLTAWLCRRLRWRPHQVIMVVILASWMLTAVAALHKVDEYYATYWRFEYRLTAMLGAAALVSFGVDKLRNLPPWWLFSMAGIVLQCNPVPDSLKYTLGSLAIALGCVKLKGQPVPWLESPVLIYMGTVSFSLYLWQQLAFVEVNELGKPLALCIALATGACAHHLWDDKLHKLCREWLLRGR